MRPGHGAFFYIERPSHSSWRAGIDLPLILIFGSLSHPVRFPILTNPYKNMKDHMYQHRQQFKSWSTVSSCEAVGHQILGCQWVFKYKTDKHMNLKKCKATLGVCGNQQRKCDLPTRATTSAVTSLRVLLAVAAKFDLETLKLNLVNAFVVYTRGPRRDTIHEDATGVRRAGKGV